MTITQQIITLRRCQQDAANGGDLDLAARIEVRIAILKGVQS